MEPSVMSHIPDAEELGHDSVEILGKREGITLCDCCRAVFQNGITIPHTVNTPPHSPMIQVAHHWTPQTLIDALEMECILCCQNFSGPALRPAQEAAAKCDQSRSKKTPLTVFKFFGNEMGSGFTGLDIEYYSEEYRPTPDIWGFYWVVARYRILSVMSYEAGYVPDPQEFQFLDTVLHFAEFCRDLHADCKAHRGLRQRAPRRVLEIDESRLVLRLLEDDWKEPYITLSHRWSIPGRPEPPKLHRANEAEMRSAGIPLSLLPPAFRDAAVLARHVGVRYLWIDSLCIFQDSAADWESESAIMGNIYAGGFFNIAVADEESSRDGWIRRTPRRLPMIASPSNLCLQSLWKEWGYDAEVGPIALHDNLAFKKEISHSMLLARGWVHQEVLLAPATLYLTRQEAWWYCSNLFASEIYPFGAPSFTPRFGVANMRILPFIKNRAERTYIAGKTWRDLMTAFSRTEFTYPSDRTKALAGVICNLGHIFGRYFAGHWHPSRPGQGYNFVHQLLWQRLIGSGFRRQSSAERDLGGSTKPEPGEPIVPTWSWLSCPNLVTYSDVANPRYPFVPLRTPPDLDSLDHFGWPLTRKSAALHLGVILVPIARNPLFAALGIVIAGPLIPGDGERTARLAYVVFDCKRQFEEAKAGSEASNGGMDGYFFIPFIYCQAELLLGLVVKEQKERLEGADERRVFRRVGAFTIAHGIPSPEERGAEHSDDTWDYVFADWDLARNGGEVIYCVGLSDHYMVARVGQDLDEIYLV